jgi:hypothetical protein
VIAQEGDVFESVVLELALERRNAVAVDPTLHEEASRGRINGCDGVLTKRAEVHQLLVDHRDADDGADAKR